MNNNFLNPHLGRDPKDSIAPYGGIVPSILPGGYSGSYNASSLRSIGIKTPTIYAGWGYDKQLRPVPSEYYNNQISGNIGINTGTYLKTLNLGSGYFGSYGQIGFSTSSTGIKKDVPFGGSVPESHYVAGPLDIRFDYRSGLWKLDHTFFAKIMGTGVPFAGLGEVSIMNYSWKEVGIDKEGAEIPVPFPASGWSDRNRAINKFDVGKKYYDYNQLIIPSGTVVNMKAERFANEPGILYSFYLKTEVNRFIPVRILGSHIFSPKNLNFLYAAWKYAYEEVEIDSLGINWITKTGGLRGSRLLNIKEVINTSYMKTETFSNNRFGTQVLNVIKPIPVGSVVEMYFSRNDEINLSSDLSVRGIGYNHYNEFFNEGPNPIKTTFLDTIDFQACCFKSSATNNNCLGKKVFDCILLEGIPMGVDSQCDTSNCEQELANFGGCCIGNASIWNACVFVEQNTCLALDGVFVPDAISDNALASCGSCGSIMTSDTYGITGACCREEILSNVPGSEGDVQYFSSCFSLDEMHKSICFDYGGFYQGDGTSCVTVPGEGDFCRIDPIFPLGSCCLNNGNCADGISSKECLVLEGKYMGDNTTCGVVNCFNIPGACCEQSGICTDSNFGSCNGAFLGYNTVCDFANC